MADFESIRAAVTPPVTKPNTSVQAANSEAGGKTLPPDSASPAIQVEQPAPARADIEQSVAKIADYIQSVQRNLSFSLDDSSGKTVITVTDTETDQVVRQIPSQYILELAQNLKELQDKLADSKGNLLEVRV